MVKLYLAAAALLVLVGCGAENVQAAPSVATTSKEVAPMTQPATPAAPGIVDAITAAGGTCGPAGARGEQPCELRGISFKLAVDGWAGQSAARKQACAAGWINENYLLLTDGVWTIATDHHEDLDTIKTVLAGQGVTSETRPYCS